MASIRNISLVSVVYTTIIAATVVTIAIAEIFVFTPGYAERKALAAQNVPDFQRGLHAAQHGQYDAAFELWKGLASAGDRSGRYGLGLLYWNGDGVTQNRSVALHLMKSAAKAGLHEAQYRLGIIYAAGEGIEQDFPVARDWFRKAAQQGHAGGQYHLGVMYAKGLGVARDFETANMWVSIAAVGGNEAAREIWKGVANLMSDAEMEAIIVRVRDCTASGFEECSNGEKL